MHAVSPRTMQTSLVAKQCIPGALLMGRFTMGVILLVEARDGNTGTWFLPALSAGILSDILDGMIASHLKVATAKLREADSWIDAWFFLCAVLSAWLVHRDALRPFAMPLIVMIAIYGLSLAVSLIKYGRFASYHAHSARVAGGLLFLAAVQLFGLGHAGWLLWAAIVAAILSHIERIAITFLLPEWTHDVPTVWHARRMRRGI